MKEFSEKQLKDGMTLLVKELHNPVVSNSEVHERQIIAKAVQLGMKYQEAKIKEGINIVFEELHK
jgi:hypothetical protein